MLGQTFGDRFMWSTAAFRMIKFTFISVRAFFTVWAGWRRISLPTIITVILAKHFWHCRWQSKHTHTHTRFHLLRLNAQKVVQCRSGSTQWIVGRHKPIVDKRIHEHSFAHHLFEFTTLRHQIAVIVIGHNYAVIFNGQLK